MYCGFIDEGLKVLDEVLRSIGERLPRTAVGRLAGILWQRLLLRLPGISYRERDETQISGMDLVHTDILRSLTMGVGGANVLLASYACVRLLRQALCIGETSRIFFGLCMEANLVSANNPESAYLRRLITECEKIQANWKGPHLPYIETAHSFACFMQGLWSESKRYTQSALRIIDEHGGMFWERGMMNNQFIWALFYLGEIDAMDRHAQLVLRDARNRGDLFSSSGMVLGLGNFPILNREGPQMAGYAIDEILRHWSVDGYHLQHYWALLSRANIDIFIGKPEIALDRIQKDWGRLRNHLLMLIPAVRNEARFLRARAALSLAVLEKGEKKRELLKKAAIDAKKLAKQRLRWTQATSQLVIAGARMQEGRTPEALDSLRQALAVLDECSMRLYAAAARIRMGQILGGDEGRKLENEGFAYMKSQNIRNPPAMLEILAPGFS
jgi:tetratricopeptide (TPR) repeat protein